MSYYDEPYYAVVGDPVVCQSFEDDWDGFYEGPVVRGVVVDITRWGMIWVEDEYGEEYEFYPDEVSFDSDALFTDDPWYDDDPWAYGYGSGW